MSRTNGSVAARVAAFLAIAVVVPTTMVGAHVTAGAATLPSISVADVTISEGTGGTKIATFTLTQDVRGKSKVNFMTKDGTATSPSDYLAHKGSVRFAGKKLTRTVSVTIIGDAIDEPDETFFLELSGATGASIADGEAVATITDDDPPPAINVPSTLSVPEGQTGDTSLAAVDVKLSAPSAKKITVDWMTNPVSATAGTDYTTDSGTIEFAPGEAEHVLLIMVTGDNADEGDETFTVTFSNEVNATLPNATETVTIVDNDPPPPGPLFSVDDVKKREGASGTTTLTFTVTRSDTTNAVTVHFSVENGTAFSPGDYSAPVPGTLPFAAGVGTATVNVAVVGDRVLEHNETLLLDLDGPSAGGILDGQGTGTILNDDTRTTVAVKVLAAKHRVSVHGRLSRARPGKHMVVKLFRRKSGAWVRFATKRPALKGKTDVNGDGFSDSSYATAVPRAKRGSCKVVASYPGDAKFSPSKATKLFRC